MAFKPDYWKNGESGGTPITAAELNRIEEAGAAKAAQGPKGDPGTDGADGHSPEITWDGTTIVVDGVDGPDLQGPQGPKGDKGAKGDPGSDGADGADGFPTESQWNDLVARVDALEAAAEA